MFEFFFNYPLSIYREASLAFESPAPLWLIITFIIVATALVFGSMIYSLKSGSLKGFASSTTKKTNRVQGFSIVKIALLGLLQLSVLGLIFLMFTQPVLVTERLVQEENELLFLLDSSQSMAYGTEGQPRINDALTAFRSAPVEQISQEYQVRRYLYADSLQQVNSYDNLPDPTPGSELGDSLLAVLQQASTESIGAIILASDGVDSGSEFGAISSDQLAEIAAYGVPIHSIGVGRTTIEEDLEIARIQMPAAVLPNTLVRADIAIRHDAAGTARVKIYDGERYLSAQEIQLPDTQNGVSAITNATIEFDAGARGFKNIQFVLDPIEAERNIENNRVSKLLEVRNGDYRILYVDGEPRWEYKFIRRALESDSTLNLHTLLWVSENKFYRQGIDDASQLSGGFPRTREELFGYDALIIGSVAAPQFSPEQQQMIFDFVGERGGSLLMLGGRLGLAAGSWGNSVVGELLPARLKDIENSFVRETASAQMTSSGVGSTMLKFTEDEAENLDMWQTMPMLADYQKVGTLRPAATVLLTTEADEPLFLSQPFGKGKSSIFATASSWRWQMSLPSDDDRHHRFWRQLVRAQVVDTRQQFDLQINTRGNIIELRAEIANADFEYMDDVRVTGLVTAESGSTTAQTVEFQPVAGEPGVYRSEFSRQGQGVFFIDAIASQNDQPLDSARIAFEVPEDRSEYFNIRQNRSQLERLSDLTGGQYWPPDNLNDLPLAIARSKAGITDQQRDPLWSIPLVFLLLIVLKASEWLLRRRWGRI